MNYGEFVSHRFPSKGMNVLLDLHAVHWDLLFPHVKHLKVAVKSSEFCLVALSYQLAVAVHLDAEVVARLLPVHLAVSNAEQILRSHFVSEIEGFEFSS